MRANLIFILFISLFFYSCKTSKNTETSSTDSTKLILRDSTIYHIKDSINYKTLDSSYLNQNLTIYKFDTVTKTNYKYLEYKSESGNKKEKDSTHINYKDSVIYNYKDSVRTFYKAETINKKTDFISTSKLFIFEILILIALLIYFKYIKK